MITFDINTNRHGKLPKEKHEDHVWPCPVTDEMKEKAKHAYQVVKGEKQGRKQ